MLAGIINEKDNHYYINLEEENNVHYVSIIHNKKNKTRCLNKEEAHHLFQTMFTSQLTFQEKKDGYDIYLDEANNKRYFKNGREDYKLLFQNNGVSAIYYSSEEKENESMVKKIKLIGKEVAFELFFSMTLSSLILVLIYPSFLPVISYEANNIVYRIVNEIAYNEDLTVEEMQNLLNSSSHLSEKQKELLYNEDLFQTVLDIAGNDCDYILRVKLDDVKIKEYDGETDENGQLAGYYNPLEPNIIHINNQLEEGLYFYDDVLIHEFIHLLQNELRYHYIADACAEIIKYEYYNMPINAYEFEVKNVRVLMEIIGPKPLLECNFSDNSTSLEEEVRKYLDEEDANTFMELIVTSSHNFYERLEKDAIIDDLLAKMYFNKTGKNIWDDTFMSKLLQGEIKDRIYFNSSREEYAEDCYLPNKYEELEAVNIYDLINSDQVEKYLYHHKIEFIVDEDDNLVTLNGETIPEDIVADLKEKVLPSSPDRYIPAEHLYDQETHTFTGLYYVTLSSETTDFNEINPSDNDKLEIYLKDGSIVSAVFNSQEGWYDIRHYRLTSEIEPSIKEKFSEQLQNESIENTNYHHL